ncbi:hypothetical protein IWGMT90018_20370 [Mycobacterium kiyosense]|nr:hypothetical protein IWGMT90018_20370 [Mycobacterium kiyosense]
MGAARRTFSLSHRDRTDPGTDQARRRATPVDRGDSQPHRAHKGLTLAALQLRTVDDALARQHYAEHDGKPFFGSLLEFITSGPVVAAVVEGPRAIAAFRQLAGGTDPVDKATPGTIRGDFGLETQYNLVHGSDSAESAQREIGLWFPGL